MFKNTDTLFTPFNEDKLNSNLNKNDLLEAINQDYMDYIKYNYSNNYNNMPNSKTNKYKLVLIDGSNLLSSSFFGSLPREYSRATTEEDKKRAESLIMNANGVYINAVYTALRILFDDILKNSGATHLAISLDLTRNSFRKSLYPEYKATRKETSTILKPQFHLFKEILESCGIKVFVSNIDDEEIYEADDFTGSIVAKFSKDIPISIYSRDYDHLQLLEYNNTSLWVKLDSNTLNSIQNKCVTENIPFNNKNIPYSCFEYTDKNILALKNRTADTVVDIKALGGDHSDNIPGVKGISEFTASELMIKYKNIEKLYEELDKLNKDEEALKEFGDMLKRDVITTSRTPVNALLKYREDAFLSKELGKIKCDIDLNCTLEDLRLNINKEELYKQLDKHKMYRLKSIIQ